MKSKFFRKNSRNIRVVALAGVIAVGAGIIIVNEMKGYSIIQTIIAPISSFVSGSTNEVTEFVDRKYVHNEQKMRIDELEEENSNLRKELIQNVISQKELQELQDLKKMLNLKEEQIYDEYITGNIISKDGNGFYSTFLISAGKKDGVKNGSLVLSGSGLAGVVEEAYDNYSKAVSILDSKMAMSFRIVRNDKITGIASQNINDKTFEGIEPGLLKAYCYETDQEILIGDIVITSGMGVYPEGIEIGEVYEIIDDSTNLLKYIKIKPYTNFNNLNKVMMINSRNMN